MKNEDFRRVELSPHNVVVENRERLSVSGVAEVISFDENEVSLVTSMGILTVGGQELHVEKLNLEMGELAIVGRVEAVVYEDEQQRRRGTVGCHLQAAVQHLHLHRRLQADKALPCLRRKTQILSRFFRVDPARRGLQAGIQGRQRKAALFVQRVLQRKVKLGQRVVRVRLRHPEIRPGDMSAAHQAS